MKSSPPTDPERPQRRLTSRKPDGSQVSAVQNQTPKSLSSDSEFGIWGRSNDEILEEFTRITEHDSGRTARQYAHLISAQQRRYARHSGRQVPLLQIVTDSELWAEVLSCDRKLRGSGKVSRRALITARSAFAALVAGLPPPPGLTRDELRRNLEHARRATTEQHGQVRVFTRGRPRGEDTRAVPTEEEIERTIAAIRRLPAPLAGTAADLLGFLYLTSMRIKAALALTADELYSAPDGRLWVYAYEKARPDARPVLVRTQRREPREAWAALPAGESLWSEGSVRLIYSRFRRLLKRGCGEAGVAPFTPHRLRSAFASDLAHTQGLGAVRLAGGWLAEPVAEGYVHARHHASTDQ